jgi:hypothetical protein
MSSPPLTSDDKYELMVGEGMGIEDGRWGDKEVSG